LEWKNTPTLDVCNPGVRTPAVKQPQTYHKESIKYSEDENDSEKMVGNEQDSAPHMIIDEVDESTAEHAVNVLDPREAEDAVKGKSVEEIKESILEL